MCMSVYAMTYVNVGRCDACEGVPEDKDIQKTLLGLLTHISFKIIYGKKSRLRGVYTGSLFL